MKLVTLFHFIFIIIISVTDMGKALVILFSAKSL